MMEDHAGFQTSSKGPEPPEWAIPQKIGRSRLRRAFVGVIVSFFVFCLKNAYGLASFLLFLVIAAFAIKATHIMGTAPFLNVEVYGELEPGDVCHRPKSASQSEIVWCCRWRTKEDECLGRILAIEEPERFRRHEWWPFDPPQYKQYELPK